MSGDRVVARAVDSAFRCDVCGERCTSKGALDEHVATHGEEPTDCGCGVQGCVWGHGA